MPRSVNFFHNSSQTPQPLPTPDANTPRKPFTIHPNEPISDLRQATSALSTARSALSTARWALSTARLALIAVRFAQIGANLALSPGSSKSQTYAWASVSVFNTANSHTDSASNFCNAD
jgi:hypothetical protein